MNGHGGERRAVFVYQMDSYRYWQNQLGRNDFVYGQFGENFTVDGLPDAEVCIGDRYRIGSALFEVTQPRVTCYRLGIRLNEPEMAALVVKHGRPGFYFRVLEEGKVEAGDEITRVASGPEQMSVVEISALLYMPGHPRNQLERALRIPSLSTGWRKSVLVNVNAVDHLCDGAVTCYGRGRHPASASDYEMLAEGFDDDVLDIGCRNPGNRSNFCRLGLSMEAWQRDIIAITDAGLGRIGTSVVSGGDFGGPVSASKNSVPGGQGSATDVRRLSHGSQTSAEDGLTTGPTVDRISRSIMPTRRDAAGWRYRRWARLSGASKDSLNCGLSVAGYSIVQHDSLNSAPNNRSHSIDGRVCHGGVFHDRPAVERRMHDLRARHSGN
jgi:MOSC domain-containing protein YiiM